MVYSITKLVLERLKEDAGQMTKDEEFKAVESTVSKGAVIIGIALHKM